MAIAEDTDIIFNDKDGAIITNDFLLDFLKISEKGVILEVVTDKVDEISLDGSLASTVTVVQTSSDVEVSFMYILECLFYVIST